MTAVAGGGAQLQAVADARRSCDVVSLLEAYPDLGDRLAAFELVLARRAYTALLRHAPDCLTSLAGAGADGLGLLVVRGWVARRGQVGSFRAAQLLGPGALVRFEATVQSRNDDPAVTWEVCAPASLAVLDARFVRRAAEWPQLLGRLVAQADERARCVSATGASATGASLTERIHLVLLDLALADRPGRAVADSDGLLVPLVLSHELLGEVVGARRESVCRSMRELRDRGVVRASSNGRWVLRTGSQNGRTPGRNGSVP